MRERGSERSRSPVAKNLRRSELYLSGANRLALSSCLPARVRSVIARVRGRLAIRGEPGFNVLNLSLFSKASGPRKGQPNAFFHVK